MKCPGCGYVSFDRLETCKRCGAPMSALSDAGAATGSPARSPAEGRESAAEGMLFDAPEEPAPVPRRGRSRGPRARAAAAPPEPARMPDDALELSEDDLALHGGAVPEDAGMPFHIDDDVLAFGEADGFEPPRLSGGTDPAADWQPFTVEPPEPFFGLPGEDGAGGGGEPVIDRDEEIPERFWAPEIAGLRRRAAALVLDLAILALLLGIFFAAAYVALGVSGFDAGHLLSPAGLQASVPPFAMLAILLSLAYQSFFHARAGCTPGKALAGVEVRTADGGVPSGGRVLLRWLCASLGLAVAGVGLAWPLVEPRRRGWADLLSGTVVARRRR